MKKEKNTDWIYYVFVFLSAIAVFTYILHVGYISSGSMEPALMTHDVTVSSRIIISPIKCGDIISFKWENGDIYGKRSNVCLILLRNSSMDGTTYSNVIAVRSIYFA